MAANDIINGATASYNRTIGVKIDMDEAISILRPTDVPLQQWLPGDTTTSTKVEWLEEDLTPLEATATAVSGTGPWNVTVANSDVFRVGDVLHKRDAAATVQYLVDSITSSTVFVVSGFAGNATAPATNDVLDIVGQYRTEGSDPDSARSKERDSKYNVTQWAQEKIEVTRTQQKRAMYGLTDPYGHELGKKFKELAIRYERSLVQGQRTESGDKKKRFMGGLFYYISSNTASNTKANAATALNSLIRSCYEDGGSPDVIMCSPAVKEAISQNVDASMRRSDVREKVGGSVIDKFMSDFGEVELIVNRHFPKTKGLALQKEHLSRVVFDPYFHETLAKTGDAEKGHVVGEFTLRAKNEAAHGILTLTDAS